MAGSDASLACPLVAEFVGTFVFFSVILRFASKAWCAFPIGLALCAAILFGGSVSGGHFNPAVTFMTLVKGDVSSLKATCYVVAQLAAAMAALGFAKVC